MYRFCQYIQIIPPIFDFIAEQPFNRVCHTPHGINCIHVRPSGVICQNQIVTFALSNVYLYAINTNS